MSQWPHVVLDIVKGLLNIKKKLGNSSFDDYVFCISHSFYIHRLSRRRKHQSEEVAPTPFINKKSNSSIPPHPTTFLTSCFPLLAQTALLSTWIILVLKRRADPEAALTVATAHLQVRMWNCRDVDFIHCCHSWSLCKTRYLYETVTEQPPLHHDDTTTRATQVIQYAVAKFIKCCQLACSVCAWSSL